MVELAIALLAVAVPVPSFAQVPTFNALVTTYTNSSFNTPTRAAVGDFNGDGKLDAIITDGSTSLRLMQGNGDATFTVSNIDVPGTNPGAIKAADLNGDGKLDAVTVSNGAWPSATTVILNSGNDAGGTPQFVATNYFSGFNEIRSVSVADLNGDGASDLVVANAFGTIRVHVNDGAGGFTLGQLTNIVPSGGSTGGSVLADLNGDGTADYLVTSNQVQTTQIFFGAGNGTLQTPATYPSDGILPAVGDLNNDGKPDFATVTSSGTQMVYLNNGNGTFSGPTLNATGVTVPSSHSFVDINGDGDLDALMTDQSSGSGVNGLSVFLGDGAGGFGAAYRYKTNAAPFDATMGDFNNDGKADFATVGVNDKTYGVLTNTTVFAPPTVFASGTAAVTTWDPIFPSSAYSPWQAQCSAAPQVGPDANWVNPHAAFVFPLGSHPWEGIAPFNFAANWINAWSNLGSLGPAGQSWTKYSTEVTGEGDFVVQFLADNCSWIYVDDQLIGVQDDNWSINGTGRYPLTLTGAGPHTLSFIIWDGGGAAGGKFRLETRQSFIEGGGDPDDLPVKGPSTTMVSFGDGPFVYTGTPFIAIASVSPGGDATITYSGDCTNAGNTCTATATYDGDATHFASSATASITIVPVQTTTTVTFGGSEFVYTGSALEALATAGATIQYSGSCTNVGTCTATATTAGDANHIASSAIASADITPAPTTTTVSFDAPSYVYTGAAIVATASDGATIVYSGSCTNVGTCTATATNPGDANHSSSSAIATAEITKAATTTTVSFDAPSYVYSGSAIVATASEGATIVYSGSCTNVGTCTATATNAGDANHSSSSAIATAEITKAPTTTTVSFAAPSFVYSGAAIVATASEGAAIVYSGSCINVGTCTATATNPGDANHTGSSAIATALITKAPTTTTVSFGAGSFVYTGSAFTATASTSPIGTAAITYIGECTNAGGNCTAKATNPGDANHSGSEATATISIARAVATIVATPYTVEYNGQPHAATFTITGVNGQTGATVGSVSHNTTHTNVGTYADTWSFAGANYVSVGATPITNKITDTTAPVITSISNNAGSLWPPNHKMVAVNISATAGDLVGVASLKVISVTSSEPDNGLGDGDTAGDAVITGPLSVSVRAERSGNGNGRTYTITVEARDAAGNASTKTTTVFVPKSQGK